MQTATSPWLGAKHPGQTSACGTTCGHCCAPIDRRIILNRTMPSPGNGDGLLRSYVATSDDRAAQWEPTYSIAPRTKAPVVREFVDEDGASHRTLELARWGLHPSWAKDKGPRPINARLETVRRNGRFRGARSRDRKSHV